MIYLADRLVGSSEGLLDYARLVSISGGKYIHATENFTDYERTHLQALKRCIFKTNTVLALPPNSSLKGYFNWRIMEIKQYGFDRHWYRMATMKTLEYMDNFYTSYVSRDFEPKPLNLGKIQAALCILVFGYICAFVAFIFELYCHQNKMCLCSQINQ